MLLKKELELAAGIDTSDFAAKKNIAWKAEVDKLEINKLTNVPTSPNSLKTKVDDVVYNEVVKNTNFNTLNEKVYSFRKENS